MYKEALNSHNSHIKKNCLKPPKTAMTSPSGKDQRIMTLFLNFWVFFKKTEGMHS